MNEIGKRRTRYAKTRDKKTGKLVIKLDEQGRPVCRTLSDNVFRVTRDELGGQFGKDKRRKLVIGLVDGDIISLRPQGTRQEVTLKLEDVYRFALRCMAQRKVLEKARDRKINLQAQRERAKIARYDRKIKKTAIKLQNQ